MDCVKVGEHRLYLGDCREVLPTLEEESVTLVVTSPPYAFGKDYELDQSYEQLQQLLKDVAKALFPVVEKSGFCFLNFSATTRWDLLPEQVYSDAFRGAGWLFHSRRVWSKALARTLMSPSGINLSIPQAQFENLFTFRRPPNKKEWDFDRKLATQGIWSIEEIFGYKGIQGESIKSRHVHPAQFPVELAILPIRLWSQQRDVVLDPFGGIFSTVIAAHHEGRVGIAIEKDEKYFEIGVARVQEYVSQQMMFSPEEIAGTYREESEEEE